PAGLQWTLSYSPNDVAALTIVPGPALIASGKTVNCVSSIGSLTCLAFGMTNSTIGGGGVCVLTAVLVPTRSARVDSVALGNLAGAASDGTYVSVSGTGGTISVTQPALPSVSGLQCSPATVVSGASSTCTVTLSAAAPSGGVAVALTDTSAAL